MSWTYNQIAKMIDHALLLPNLVDEQVQSGIKLALAYDVASVCIMPCRLPECAEALKGSTVVPSTTVGFPHGLVRTSTKLQEAEVALAAGCRELDMVLNLSLVKSGRFAEVKAEVKALTEMTHDKGQRLKLIFENAYLDDSEKIQLCEIATEVGVDWVKTSTGFASSGATHSDIRLMRQHCGESVEVKAAGGVRTLADLLLMRELGATRVGASATSQILDEARRQLGLPVIDMQAQPLATKY